MGIPAAVCIFFMHHKIKAHSGVRDTSAVASVISILVLYVGTYFIIDFVFSFILYLSLAQKPHYIF